MVRRLEQESVQVEEVPGYEDGQDLSPSVWHQPVAAGDPAGDHKSRARCFAFDRDIRTSRVALFSLTQGIEHADVPVR